MRRAFILILFSFMLVSCTTTRWVVTEQNAVDESVEPRVILEQQVFVLENPPSVDNPVAGFQLYQVKDLEYIERVKVERNVQQYKPKWGFVLLGLTGAAISAVAANSNLVFTNASTTQKLGLNLTAGIIGVLSFTNLQPSGDPIQSGETKLMRQSGSEVVRDSSRVQPSDTVFADVSVRLNDEELFSQTEVPVEEGVLELNLGSFSEEVNGRIDESSEIEVSLNQSEYQNLFSFPITQFLAPYVKINSLVVSLRSTPEEEDLNVMTEVGQGSFLELVENSSDDYYRVVYEGEEYFVQKDEGSIEWLSTAESGSALVFEFADLPFGEIDVEHSMPVLKPNNPADRGLVLSNGFDNDVGQRQYLSRDHQLFETYLKTSLRLRENQVEKITSEDLLPGLSEVPGMNQDGSLYVYLSGFAEVREEEDQSEIYLISDGKNGVKRTALNEIIEDLKRIEPDALFLFIDLDYTGQIDSNSNGFARNGSSGLLQRTANRLVRDLPNSAVVFSNRPGQQSSLYTGIIDGNKRHSIFNYFLGEAIQQRRTRISDLVNHLDRNVDYMSRRLHDLPQEVQAFGNLNLNLAR
ncbi:hypothetical protein [Rhodohalobacter barkolensis]|nr:hypothetical protein [Rhodohalobacter barkolensis]